MDERIDMREGRSPRWEASTCGGRRAGTSVAVRARRSSGERGSCGGRRLRRAGRGRSCSKEPRCDGPHVRWCPAFGGAWSGNGTGGGFGAAPSRGVAEDRGRAMGGGHGHRSRARACPDGFLRSALDGRCSITRSRRRRLWAARFGGRGKAPEPSTSTLARGGRSAGSGDHCGRCGSAGFALHMALRGLVSMQGDASQPGRECGIRSSVPSMREVAGGG